MNIETWKHLVPRKSITLIALLALLAQMVAACAPVSADASQAELSSLPATPAAPIPTPGVTPLPTRQPFLPGELVDYTVQSGDTLALLSVRFNTTEEEIRTANPIIPREVTLLPPGMPMKIPIYYLPLWGSPYQILPDELFVNGPAQVGFNTAGFIATHAGWLKDAQEWAADANRSAAEIVDLVATNYSVSPRLLLALLEYHSHGLTQSTPPDGALELPLGKNPKGYTGLYLQLIWAANTLNNLYYADRAGQVATFDHLDGTMERPDPWQNAASVALQMYFARFFAGDNYTRAISPVGFAQTYQELFGSPWEKPQPHLPGSLQQPELRLPFQDGKSWAFTGGPHTGWGEGAPLAAIDFAPPSMVSGCVATDEWATAMADGVIARAEPGLAILDLDGDGDERTGWTIMYLHAELAPGIAKGTKVKLGDVIGHPSCEAGHATGTHIHLARKYNGEWILADGPLPFNLEGWVAHAGSQAYEGTLTKFGRTITACECSDKNSQLRTGQ